MVDWTDEMDNVEWLRKSSSDEWCGSALNKCADEIERLREELAAYRARKPVVYSPDAQAMSDRVKAAEAERDALREENARLNSELSEERERVTVLEDELFLLEQKDCNEENYLQSQLDAVVIERNTLREENAQLREETDGGKADDCKSCGCQYESWKANYQRLTIQNDALREENARLREGRMAEQEREELIEKMRKVLINARLMGFDYESAASAALAVAEPVIREQCARIALRKKKQKYYDSNSIGWEGEWEVVSEFPQEGEKIATAIREGKHD